MAAKWIVAIVVGPLIVIGGAAALILHGARQLGTASPPTSVVPAPTPHPASLPNSAATANIARSTPAATLTATSPIVESGGKEKSPQELLSEFNVFAAAFVEAANHYQNGNVDLAPRDRKLKYELLFTDVVHTDSLIHPVVATVQLKQTYEDKTSNSIAQTLLECRFAPSGDAWPFVGGEERDESAVGTAAVMQDLVPMKASAVRSVPKDWAAAVIALMHPHTTSSSR